MKRPYYDNIAKLILKGFKKKVTQLHEPTFENNDFYYLKKCLKQGIVSSTGNAIIRNKFEDEISNYTKSKFALATINGVSALHACLKSLNVRKNHEVLVPSITFVASVHSILYAGAIPHFVDASEDDLGIDPYKLDTYLTKITKYKNGNYYNKKTITVGVDPLIDKFKKKGFYKDINYKISDFFGSNTVKKYKIFKNKFKIITALSVFYDLKDPNDFLRSVKSILDKDGIFVLEFADLYSIFKYKMFDTICHEHLEYYSTTVINEICFISNIFPSSTVSWSGVLLG